MRTLGMSPHHLTEEQVERVLMGAADVSCWEHLAECARCQARVDEFTESIAVFNQAAMAWSVAKSNSLNRDVMGGNLAGTFPWFNLGRRGLLTCFALLMLVLTGVSVKDRRPDFPAAVSRSGGELADAGEGGPDSELASDNQMLKEIDSAINRPEPSPAQRYGNGAAAQPMAGKARVSE